MTRTCAALAASLLLAACAWEETDLNAELAAATKDMRGRVEALPQVQLAEPLSYTGEKLPDPFHPWGRR